MAKSYAHCDLQPMQIAVLQNALKIFKNMPKSLMDIVKRTDPSTVTQHGLYMRPLTDPSLHPLVAKAPPAEAPGTPPNEEEQKPATPVACKPSEPATAQKSIQLPKTDEQPGAQEADMASADAVPVLQKETQNLSLGTSNPKPSPEDIPNLHAKTAENAADFNQSDAKPTGSPAEMNGRALPIGAPTPVGEPSVSTGNWTSSKGTASVPMEKLAPVGVPSATKGSPTASDISPEKNVGGTSAAGKGQESSADDDDDVCWGRGRVSLLGDAAHATIPNGTLLLCPLHVIVACMQNHDHKHVHMQHEPYNAATPCLHRRLAEAHAFYCAACSAA